MQQETYVVATDLSPRSLAAYRATLELARTTGARVSLFCAVPVALVEDDPGAHDRIRRALEHFAGSESHDGVDVTCDSQVSQDAPKAIVAQAVREHAALLAVGPTGVSNWRRFVLGSVTERVLRSAPVSVLVVRGAAVRPVTRVIAALDCTPHSARALRAAVSLAKSHRAPLTALHAVESEETALFPIDGFPSTSPAFDLASARRSEELAAFRTWVRSVPSHGVEVEAIVLEGPPAQAVERAASSPDGCLVVVGTGAHSRAHRIFFGSVARSIATHCPASVLIVRDARAARSTPRSAAAAHAGV